MLSMPSLRSVLLLLILHLFIVHSIESFELRRLPATSLHIEFFPPENTPPNTQVVQQHLNGTLQQPQQQQQQLLLNDTNTYGNLQAADDELCSTAQQNDIYYVNVLNYAEKTQLHKVSKEDLQRFAEFFYDDLPLPQIEQRMSGDPTDIELCSSTSRLVHPEKGQTADSGWQYILQTPDQKQGVLEEYCINEDKACSYTENFPKNYVTRCKQYYGYRTMAAIENGVLSKKEFLMRTTCKCVLRIDPKV